MAVGDVLSYAFDDRNDAATRSALFERAHASLVPGGLLMFDIRAAFEGPPLFFEEGPDWAVFVQSEVEGTAGTQVKRITSFREVDGCYRRSAETHRLLRVDAEETVRSLHSHGFRTQASTAYGIRVLPPGVVVLRAWKGARD